MSSPVRPVLRSLTRQGLGTRSRRPLFAVFTPALPGVLLAVVVVVDVFTPSLYFRFAVPLIVAAPALAAAATGVWGVLVFTCLGVGVTFLLAILDGKLFTPTFYGGLTALAVIFAASLLPGHLSGRRERQLARARSVAEVLQRAVLIPVPEQISSLRTATAYLSAEEEARIGGDLYEALDTPYGVRMIIGDVRGKGLASVGAAANLLGAFREIAPHAADLPTVAARLDESVRRYNTRVGLEFQDFITATIICVRPEQVVRFVCCGHPGPMLLRGKTVRDVHASRPSLPLGLGELDTDSYQVDTLDFADNDCLLLFTDGVTEARDPDGVFYPLADRLAAWVDAEPDQLLKQLVYDLVNHTGGRLGDDAAILACRRKALPIATRRPEVPADMRGRSDVPPRNTGLPHAGH